MPSRPKSAVSSNSSGGVFVKITLTDTQGRVFINLLVWNGSYTTADELCNNQAFLRGSVSIKMIYSESSLTANNFRSC